MQLKHSHYNLVTVFISSVYSAEEKKPVKRSYQKIQEEEDDEDDDYRSHNSPRNTGATATQLVGRRSFFSPYWPTAPPHPLNTLLMHSFRQRSWWRPCRIWRTPHQVTQQFVRRSRHCHRKFRTSLCWKKSLVRPEVWARKDFPWFMWRGFSIAFVS